MVTAVCLLFTFFRYRPLEQNGSDRLKIEKLNENQIRCTLTREDLVQRQIQLAELAYGSDKAKQLFQDMMQQAFRDYGFDVNNHPLMIEAIPISLDSLILIITKVDSPDELDSRFARFSSEDGSYEPEAVSSESLTGVDDILNLITRISEARRQAAEKEARGKQAETTQAEPQENDEIFNLSRFFLFRDLETIIRAAHITESCYDGPNSLYKNPDDGNYYLIVKKADTAADKFNRLCNTLSEYGLQVDYMNGVDEFFREHMDVISADQALQTMRQL